MNHARRAALKLVIEGFLEKKKEAKSGAKTAKNTQSNLIDVDEDAIDEPLEKKKAAENKQSVAALASRYDLHTWVKDASIRAEKVQQVTHILKTAHPDAKGTQIYAHPKSVPCTNYLSSAHLGRFTPDFVTNTAANMDICAFLSLSYENQTLLDLFENADIELLGIISNDPEEAKEIARRFAAVKETGKSFSSYTLSKQIYWLVGDDPVEDRHYHLLSPLFPSSLMQDMHDKIQKHRFESKEERKAKEQRKYSDKTVYDYPDLAIRKFGGSKPQNISALNSKRRGENILLPSLPPNWKQAEISIPRGSRSIFERFGNQKAIRSVVIELKVFLESNPPPNMETRAKRDEFVVKILSEFVNYAAKFQMLEPGWSCDRNCKLSDAEKLLLDPARAEIDALFAQMREQGDWKKEVADGFGRWLNDALSGKLLFGDVEHIFLSEMFDEHQSKSTVFA